MLAHKAIVGLLSITCAVMFQMLQSPAPALAEGQGESSAAVQRMENGVPFMVTNLVADLMRDQVGDSIYFVSPLEAAEILLDCLLSEDVVQVLIAEPSLRMEYERAAALMHGEIAQAFKDALAGDIQSRARAMLWADGLMRVAPIKPGAQAKRLDWERASREELEKELYAKSDDKGLYRQYYGFAEKETGITLEQQASEESASALGIGEPEDSYDRGSFGLYSEEEFAAQFWSKVYIITLYHKHFEEHLQLNNAIEYFRSPYALNRFISGEEYFRPMFALQVFYPNAQGNAARRKEFPLLVDTTLQIWGIWLERQDAAEIAAD